MSVTCPCCASAKAVRPYTLPRYPDDHKTHFCRDCDCEWNESRRSGSAGQWRLVPVEPTAEMASAGISVRNDKGKGIDSVWAAMLDAAPPPPGAGEG